MHKISLLIVCMVFLTVSLSGCSGQKYKQGQSYLDEGRYEEAVMIFEELGEYEDSPAMVIESKYQKANALKENEEFASAIELLSSINEHKDAEKLQAECYYMLGEEAYRARRFENAIEQYNLAKGYSDSEEKIKDSKYEIALSFLEKENIEKAKEIATEIGDYKDLKELVSKYEFLQPYWGTWAEKDKGYIYTFIVFKGTRVYQVYAIDHVSVYEYEINVVDGVAVSEKQGRSFRIDSNGEMAATGGGWWQDDEVYIKESQSTEVPIATKDMPKPSVGMTVEEVYNSSWGKPEKINRTTTAYSTKEQWVYSSNRYLYFEDGRVTAIQEF